MTPKQFVAIRKKLGLSQVALAKHLGLHERRIPEIEGGHTARGVSGPVERLMIFYRDGIRPKGVEFPCDAKPTRK